MPKLWPSEATYKLALVTSARGRDWENISISVSHLVKAEAVKCPMYKYIVNTTTNIDRNLASVLPRAGDHVFISNIDIISRHKCFMEKLLLLLNETFAILIKFKIFGIKLEGEIR